MLEEAWRPPQNRDALLEAKPIQSQAVLQEAFASLLLTYRETLTFKSLNSVSNFGMISL